MSDVPSADMRRASGKRALRTSIPASAGAAAAFVMMIGCALVAVIWVGGQLAHDLDLEIGRRGAAIEASRMSVAADDRTAEVLRALERAIGLLREEWHRDRKDFMNRAERVVTTVHSDIVFQIGVTDANGVIIRTNRDPSPPAIDVGDRDFFREQRWSGSERMVVGRRMEGYIAGGRSIIMSGSLGEGEGALLLWVDPAGLMRPPHGMEPLGKLSLLLVGTDGRTRACAGDAIGEPCLDHFEGESFLSAQADSSGTLRLAARDDAGPRVGAFRALAQFPLIAVALKPEAAIDAPARERWRDLRSKLWAAGAAIMTVFTGLAIVAASRYRRMDGIRAAEERWRLALSAIGDVVWEWSAEEDLVIVRAGSSRLFEDGGDREIPAAAWIALVHPDDAPRLRSVIGDRVGSSSSAFSCEVRLRRGDGGVDWALCRGVVLSWNRDGSPARIVGALTDISDRKAIEGSLAREREETTRLNARLAEVTATDPLTGFGNPKRLTEAAERALALALEDGRPITLILMNIDHFKRVNEIRGRAAGDAALRLIARRIARRATAGDTLCRLGGEEFVLLAPGRGIVEGLALAEECRAGIAAPPLPLPGDATMELTASFGVTPLRAEDGLEAALNRAHQAVRAAKSAGGDTARAAFV